MIGTYHENQLRALLEHVRDGFARLDVGPIDALRPGRPDPPLKTSARELWKFCGSTGSDWQRAARTLEFLRDNGEEPDWWQACEPRARR
jgi:hypothetical protein